MNFHTCPRCCKPVSKGVHTCVLPECCAKYADHVFVFGSNLAGRHGAGAADHAYRLHGAVMGAGAGHHNGAYALPTKDGRLRTLPLQEVRIHVNAFLAYAMAHPHLKFYVTRVGCGLAGYKDRDISPMFAGAPDNCVLPEGWRDS